jgi:hypothetical protein
MSGVEVWPSEDMMNKHPAYAGRLRTGSETNP